MTKKINLRCMVCGNAKRVDRDDDIDPRTAVECVTNECDICNAADGGFGEQFYYDRHRREVHID